MPPSETNGGSESGDHSPLRFTDTIYPAPPLLDGGTITESTLLEILEHQDLTPEQRSAAHFALGNIALRARNYSAAQAHFDQALSPLSDQATLRSNLGVALLFLNELDRASTQLRQALLLDPDLILPWIYLGRIYTIQNRYDDAVAAFERVLSAAPENIEALRGLAQIAEARGEVAQGEEFDKRILTRDDEDSEALRRIAYRRFQEGVTRFQAGEELAAFQIWGTSYELYPAAYRGDERIVESLRSLRREYEKSDGLKRALEQYRNAFQANPNDRTILYPFVLAWLFSVGLLPEGYESLENLEESELRWTKSLELRGEHPYAHFRLALIHLYRGDLVAAEGEIQICVDRLPAKKQQMLRLGSIRELCSLLLDIERRREEFLNQGISADVWERAGFTDPFQLRAWKESGLSPDRSAEWRDAEVSPKQAREWNDVGITPELARLWRAGGFHDPHTVRRWIRSGLSPEEARRWEELCPLPIDQINQYLKGGITDPARAYRWSQILRVPFEAAAWEEFGFSPDEAIEWRGVGFTQPSEAAVYRQKGLSPDEALRAYNDAD